MLKWQRVPEYYGGRVVGYSYELYNPSGLLVARVYRGGNKWYPWSWWMADGSKRHGDSLSMHNAKESAETAYMSSLK